MTLRNRCIACQYNKRVEELTKNQTNKKKQIDSCSTPTQSVKLNKKSCIKKDSLRHVNYSQMGNSSSRQSSATITINSTTTAPSSRSHSPYFIKKAKDCPAQDISSSNSSSNLFLKYSKNRAMYEEYRVSLAKRKDDALKSEMQRKREASELQDIDEKIYMLQQFRMQNLDLCFNQQRQAQLRFFANKPPSVSEEQRCSICERCINDIREEEVHTRDMRKSSSLLSLIPTTVRQSFEDMRYKAIASVKRSSNQLRTYRPIADSPALRFQETYS